MAKSNFDRALVAVLKHEGGYVNDPQDPGGATNKGITFRTYNSWLKSQGKKNKNVKNITDREVASIYKHQYWDAIKGDQLPSGVDYCVFDYAVNSGPGRAAKELQRTVGVAVDGSIGHDTLGATRALLSSGVINGVCDRRMAFLKRLKHWGRFGKGWTRRVTGVRQLSHILAKDSAPVTKGRKKVEPNNNKIFDDNMPAPVVVPKARPKDLSKTREVAGGAAATIGTAGTVLTDAASQVSVISDYSSTLKVIFVVLMLAGIAFTVYSSMHRIKDTES
jgi:lysozyme family protein